MILSFSAILWFTTSKPIAFVSGFVTEFFQEEQHKNTTTMSGHKFQLGWSLWKRIKKGQGCVVPDFVAACSHLCAPQAPVHGWCTTGIAAINLPRRIFCRTHLTPANFCIFSTWTGSCLGTAHAFAADCSLLSTLIRGWGEQAPHSLLTNQPDPSSNAGMAERWKLLQGQ